ncbi:MAG: hypothetical protein AB7E80_14965 [Hyphomicrobiaceae bacterium]
MGKLLLHSVVAVLLTLLTQIGGIAWLGALTFRRYVLAFVLIYSALSLVTTWVAPIFGRTPLSCTASGPLRVQSLLYCALNRNYVRPELEDVLVDLAKALDQSHPGTLVQVLDANFPFLDGFPLIPHLSHDDGEKVDIAFFYAEQGHYLPGATRSPIGYFAFEEGPTRCPRTWPSLRWDLGMLQPLWRKLEVDIPRTREAVVRLAQDRRVGKLFLEPHLQRALGVAHQKVRFQGCNAARHDDHVHVQLRYGRDY